MKKRTPLLLLLFLASIASGQNTTVSQLSEGDIYQMAVAQTGIHKLSYTFLKDELGLPVDGLDPARLQLLGIPGGPLPLYSEAPRTDDLAELPVYIEGGDDGNFGPGDYLLFYGEGASVWTYENGAFRWQQNPFDEYNYYFLKIGEGQGARISPQPTLNSTAHITSEFDDRIHFEQEARNLMHEWNKGQGSGRNWYGDHFKTAREYTYEGLFDCPNLITAEPVKVKARAALRSRVASAFILEVGGQSLQSGQTSGLSHIGASSDATSRYAQTANLEGTLLLNQEKADVRARYPHPQGAGDESEGWIDFIQLFARRALRMEGAQMAFRDSRSLDFSSTTFQIANCPASMAVWEVTDPLSPQQQETIRSGNTLSFGRPTEQIREFIAFDPAAALLQPQAIGPVPNQNVHGISRADMIILYHPDFQAAAEKIAQHRAEANGLQALMVTPRQVFNEFSGGRAEPAAIRDFCRMVYDRDSSFRYLLLLGDASFDYKDVYGLGGNYIPTFQDESLHPLYAFPTDDLYGLLYGDNASDPLKGTLQMAVGRLPVKSANEASAVVDKIIRYESDPAALGDWRNDLVFVADDGDGNLHVSDADQIAEQMAADYPYMNQEKIYLDAFPRQATPGGIRFPEATEQLNEKVYRGALAVTYLGHGGPKGWAQERVLNISDIVQWDHPDRLPIFITATCTFTGFDDPTFVTAGEEVLLNPDGGAPALLTTVRAVTTSGNKRLTNNTLQALLKRPQAGLRKTIGEVCRQGKNATGDADNARKFSLIGDPAMPIALPTLSVRTLTVNEQAADAQAPDTLRALQRVTVSGVVTKQDGTVDQNFNGVVWPTLYDKAQTIQTLGQGGNQLKSYRLQQNVLFRGRASVSAGQFEFTFVIPKDINYEYGPGKLSYYAADRERMADAAGSYEGVVIGGTSPDAIADEQGPQVEVFMDTEDFVFGSIVSPAPTLLVRLQDDNGINVVGNSIGHDLEGVLNEDTQNTYLLNDFYESELDDPGRGTVRYPLRDLPEGRHRIQVKAWDVANNSSVGYTEFVVAGSEEVALQRVLNYPNPFTNRTCFQFDHNLANQEIEVLVQIYAVSGQLVKTIRRQLFSDGALRQEDCLPWDGRDDFGDRLARGVYLYKVKVRSFAPPLQQGESGFEKLVLLR